METTETLSTVDDLISILRAAKVTIAEVAGSVGLSRQGLQARVAGGSLDGLTALAVLKAALRIAQGRVDLLRRAVADTDSEE